MPSPLTEIVCKLCGKTFLTRHKESSLCSKECIFKFRYRNVKNPPRVCEHCHKVFIVTSNPSRVHKFCSRACYNKHKTKAKPKCINCGADIPIGRKPDAKFCYNSCRVAYHKDKHKKCEVCGTVFTPIRWMHKLGKYAPYKHMKTCSAKCELKLVSGPAHYNWHGGKTALDFKNHRGSGWEGITERARKRDKHVCRICGKTEAENGRRMDVHHIVTYHDINNAKKANRLSNLISLCKSCHKKEDNKIQHQQIVLPFAAIAQAKRRAARASAQA